MANTPARRQVTSIDVAKHAGVSQPTVSRAFDPDSPIADATRARVLKAATELGYHPNVIARSLKSRSTNIVGVVLANLNDSMFYPDVLDRLTTALQGRGKQMLFFNLESGKPVDEILPRLMGYQIDALFVASTTPSSRVVEELLCPEVPVVLFNRRLPGTCAHSVVSDSYSATRRVADLLLETGHRRVAYIAGLVATSTNRQRERGLTEQLHSRGYTDLLREQGAYTYESGREAARRLLSRPDRPDAIFCGADIMALGAIDVARFEYGLRVPEDLSIIGFDDIPAANWPSYNLTTVRQPVEAMVDKALELLLADPEEEGRDIELACELVLRGSARLPEVSDAI